MNRKMKILTRGFALVCLLTSVMAGCDARSAPEHPSSQETSSVGQSEMLPPQLRPENLNGGGFGPRFAASDSIFSVLYYGDPIPMDVQYDQPNGTPGVRKSVAWVFVDGIPVPLTSEDGKVSTFLRMDHPVIGEPLHAKLTFEPLTGKKGDHLAVMIPFMSNAFFDFPPGDSFYARMIGFEDMLAPSIQRGLVMNEDAKPTDLQFRKETAKAITITNDLKLKYLYLGDQPEKISEKELNKMEVKGPFARLRTNEAYPMPLQRPEAYTNEAWELILVGPETIFGEGNFRISLFKNYERIPFGDCDFIDVKLESNKLTIVPITFPDIPYEDKDILRVMVAPRDAIDGMFEDGRPSGLDGPWSNVFAAQIFYTWSGEVPEGIKEAMP